MTAIKDVLYSYYPNEDNNPGYPIELWRIVGLKQMARVMRNDFAANVNLKVLNELCLKTKYNYGPDDVVTICANMGIQTWEELNSYLTMLNTHNPDLLLSTLTGEMNISIRKVSIQQQDIVSLIVENSITDISNVYFTDTEYEAIHVGDLQELVDLNYSDEYEWIAESRDCDDISRIFKAWLSRNNLGNLSCAYCEFNGYYQDELKYAHAIILMVVKEVDGSLGVRLIEPQNDSWIWKFTDPPKDITIDRIDIRKLTF